MSGKGALRDSTSNSVLHFEFGSSQGGSLSLIRTPTALCACVGVTVNTVLPCSVWSVTMNTLLPYSVWGVTVNTLLPYSVWGVTVNTLLPYSVRTVFSLQ